MECILLDDFKRLDPEIDGAGGIAVDLGHKPNGHVRSDFTVAPDLGLNLDQNLPRAVTEGEMVFPQMRNDVAGRPLAQTSSVTGAAIATTLTASRAQIASR